MSKISTVDKHTAVFEAKPVSRKTLREMANMVRERFSINKEQLYFPIIEILESLAVSSDDFDLEIMDISELPHEEARTYPNKNKIEIRTDIYDLATINDGRSRLTIAHELGHLLLHTEENVSFSRVSDIKQLPAYKNPEWQASAFAGELLIPKHLVKGMSVEEVMMACKTSKEATTYQLKKYGYL